MKFIEYVGTPEQSEARGCPDHFGGCPVCGCNDGYRNVHKAHIFYCETHRTQWGGGWNLFSSWQYETEEDWANNDKFLADFTEVQPIHPKPLWIDCDAREVGINNGGGT